MYSRTEGSSTWEGRFNEAKQLQMMHLVERERSFELREDLLPKRGYLFLAG